MPEMVTFPGLPTKAFYFPTYLQGCPYVCCQKMERKGPGFVPHQWGQHLLFALKTATCTSRRRGRSIILPTSWPNDIWHSLLDHAHLPSDSPSTLELSTFWTLFLSPQVPLWLPCTVAWIRPCRNEDYNRNQCPWLAGTHVTPLVEESVIALKNGCSVLSLSECHVGTSWCESNWANLFSVKIRDKEWWRCSTGGLTVPSHLATHPLL